VVAPRRPPSLLTARFPHAQASDERQRSRSSTPPSPHSRAAESTTPLSCHLDRRVLGLSPPHSLCSLVGRCRRRFVLPRGSPVCRFASTPSAPPPSRCHRWEPSPCATSSPGRPRAGVTLPCWRPSSTTLLREGKCRAWACPARWLWRGLPLSRSAWVTMQSGYREPRDAMMAGRAALC
jgi:hypothetical protein